MEKILKRMKEEFILQRVVDYENLKRAALRKNSPLAMIMHPYARYNFGSPSIVDRLAFVKEKISQYERYDDFFIFDEHDGCGIEYWEKLNDYVESLKRIQQYSVYFYNGHRYRDARKRKRFAERNITLKRTIADYENFVRCMVDKFPLLGDVGE